MEPIKVTRGKDSREGWRFDVTVGQTNNATHHTVTLEESYWRMLTNEEETPEELIHRSFEFLLKRESKSSILPSFNLRLINRYFPEYETDIRIRRG